MRTRTGVLPIFLTLHLLLLVAVPAQGARLETTLEVDASALRPHLVDGARSWSWEGSSTLLEADQVTLPSQHLTFVVEAGETIVAVRVEGGRMVNMGSGADLRITPREFGEDGRPALATSSFAAGELGRAAYFPPVEARITGSHVLHGRHLVTVEVFPLRRDAAGDLWLRENAHVVVETGPATFVPSVAVRERDPGGWAQAEREALLGRIANPADLGPQHGPVVRQDGVPANALLGPSIESMPVRHLILTTAALAPAFQRLADHRTRHGLPSLVVTTDQVIATTRQGADLAETLRNYVIDAYTKWGVDYLLLGGDTEIIPTRYVRSTFYPSGSYTDIPTDQYYGGLDGNWNADGDEFFGEPFVSSVQPGDFADLGPEVSVGRAPVTTVFEANAFVDKILAYEIPATTDWQHDFMIASEVLFPIGWQAPEPVQYDGAVPAEELISTILQPCTDPDWGITRYYERPEAYPGSLPASISNVVAGLNSGQHGVFHHIGHGFYFSMSVGAGSLSPAEVDGLTNAPNYFLLYSLNCSSSAFDFNCLNERFVRNPNGGAMASIGSSRSAFPSGSEPLQEAFYQVWLCGGLERLGDVVSETRTQFLGASQIVGVTRWTQLIYTVLGDPATRLWATQPRTVSIFGPPSVDLGGDTLTLLVAEVPAGGVEGATVTLTKDGEDWASGTTDGAGIVELPFRAETLGGVTVTVAGAGVVPTEVQIPVTDPAFGVPTVLSLALSDDGVGASMGNGNGRAEGGETLELTPMFRNGSQTAFAGGVARVRSIDPHVTLLDSLVTIPSLLGGATQLGAEPFVLAIDDSAGDAHSVLLEIALQTGGPREVIDRAYLVLGAPALEVTSIALVDFGDGNGVPAIGEQHEIRVDVKNYGSGAASGLVGTLTVAQGAVTVLDGATSWHTAGGVLTEVANASDVLRVQIDGDPSLVELELTIADELGRTFVHSFDLIAPAMVGAPRLVSAGPGSVKISWDRPAVTDLRGYRIERTDDGGGPAVIATADVLLDVATFEDLGLSALTGFTYRVASVDLGGLASAYSVPLEVSTTLPELPCFPLPLGLETSSALAIGHVDGDGRPDMVIGADFVYVIDGDCKEKRDGDGDAQTFGPVLDTEGRYGPNSIVLAELDGVAGQEIVTVDRDTQNLYVLDGLGQPLPGWPVHLLNWAWGTAAVGDLDGDGDLEIVINDLSGYTYAFHHDGSEVADGDANPSTFGVIAPRRSSGGVLEAFGRTSPALVDVDGDGRAEILFGSKFQSALANDYFYALEGDGSGANAVGWPKQLAPQSGFLASPSVADIDGDSTLEIVAPCENDSLYVWHLDGTKQPGFPIRLRNDAINADSLTPSPAFGDFDGDGKLEMVVVSVFRELVGGKNIWRSYVSIRNEDGSLLPGWPQVVDDLSESSPVVGDIDGDGDLDVVYGIGGNEASDFLFAWNAQGQMIRGFPIPIAGFVRATPTLADFDGNGTLDIALATWDRLIHVWDTGAPYDAALVPWPTFRGNNNRTGVFGQHVVTSADAPVVPASRSQIASVVPNPFNPQTVIRFELGQDGQRVRLDVYDLHGRRVRSLVDGVLTRGTHDARWNGTDASGAPVATGVYFAVLQIDGAHSSARKLTLLK